MRHIQSWEVCCLLLAENISCTSKEPSQQTYEHTATQGWYTTSSPRRYHADPEHAGHIPTAAHPERQSIRRCDAVPRSTLHAFRELRQHEATAVAHTVWSREARRRSRVRAKPAASVADPIRASKPHSCPHTPCLPRLLSATSPPPPPPPTPVHAWQGHYVKFWQESGTSWLDMLSEEPHLMVSAVDFDVLRGRFTHTHAPRTFRLRGRSSGFLAGESALVRRCARWRHGRRSLCLAC